MGLFAIHLHVNMNMKYNFVNQILSTLFQGKHLYLNLSVSQIMEMTQRFFSFFLFSWNAFILLKKKRWKYTSAV